MADLKPCPFCGSTNIHSEELQHLNSDPEWFTMCNHDDCPVTDVCVFAETQELAERAWNTRAEPWRPISTAPKDGTWVLIWCRVAKKKIKMARWHLPEEYDRREYWKCQNGNEQMPTKWMPIPEPKGE